MLAQKHPTTDGKNFTINLEKNVHKASLCINWWLLCAFSGDAPKDDEQRERWEKDVNSMTPEHHRKKRSISLERNVEAMVVVDKDMTEYYQDEDIETYVLTIMNMVSKFVEFLTTQWEGMRDVGSARYEPALLPSCPTIRVLSYSSTLRVKYKQDTDHKTSFVTPNATPL